MIQKWRNIIKTTEEYNKAVSDYQTAQEQYAKDKLAYDSAATSYGKTKDEYDTVLNKFKNVKEEIKTIYKDAKVDIVESDTIVEDEEKEVEKDKDGKPTKELTDKAKDLTATKTYIKIINLSMGKIRKAFEEAKAKYASNEIEFVAVKAAYDKSKIKL